MLLVFTFCLVLSDYKAFCSTLCVFYLFSEHRQSTVSNFLKSFLAFYSLTQNKDTSSSNIMGCLTIRKSHFIYVSLQNKKQYMIIPIVIEPSALKTSQGFCFSVQWLQILFYIQSTSFRQVVVNFFLYQLCLFEDMGYSYAGQKDSHQHTMYYISYIQPQLSGKNLAFEAANLQNDALLLIMNSLRKLLNLIVLFSCW